MVAKPPNPSQGLKPKRSRSPNCRQRRRKTPESLTGIETPCVDAPLVGPRSGRKTPESLTGIETPYTAPPANAAEVAKPPNPSQGLKPSNRELAPLPRNCRKTPESLTGIETYSSVPTILGNIASQNPRIPHRD